MDDLNSCEADNADGDGYGTQAERRDEPPKLAFTKLKFEQKREGKYVDCQPSLARMFCVERTRYTLETSVTMFIAQSVRKTSSELNVLQASSSNDQFVETLRPHQKVSRKQVVTIAAPVNAVTEYSSFRSQGIVGGKSR